MMHLWEFWHCISILGKGHLTSELAMAYTILQANLVHKTEGDIFQ